MKQLLPWIIVKDLTLVLVILSVPATLFIFVWFFPPWTCLIMVPLLLAEVGLGDIVMHRWFD